MIANAGLARTQARRIVDALALVISLIVIIVALEVYVRLFADNGMQFDLEMWKYSKRVKFISDSPRIGHEHRPNAKVFLMGVQVATNSVGFRSDEVALEKPRGRTRVMMVGDSITFGWGVKQDETVSARLQSAWRQAGRDIEVINTGVGNYNTVMEVEHFLTRGNKFRPDVVILNYFINDAEPVPKYYVGWIERVSAARVYFGSRMDVIERLFGYRQQTDWRHYYQGLYDDTRNPGGWREVRDSVSKLAAHCKRNGIRLLIVHYPEIRILQPYPFKKEEWLLATLASELGVPYLDLLDGVKDQKPSDLWVTAPDPHPNGRAHGLFAQAIRQWVDSERLLP